MTETQPQQQPQQNEAVEIDCTATMEEILEKLKLLNYEKEFVNQKGLKPLNRAYFAIQINPNEQFNYFKSLVKWLFVQNEVQSGDYDKFADPATVATNIQFEMKKMGFDTDYPPIKLKSGSGPQICQILLELIDRALKVKKFQFKKPKIEPQSQQQQQIDMGVEDEPDNKNDLIDQIIVKSDEEDNEQQDVDIAQINKDISEEKQVIESKINQKDWLLECQRVAPKLTISSKSDAKEWRSHIEQAKQYSETIKQILPASRQKLEKVSDQLGKILEKIQKRENQINGNMGDICEQYKVKSDQLKSINIHHSNLKNSVKEMGEQYKQISEKLEAINTKINERGITATDNSPVQRIKTAIQNLKNEIKQMDVRMGVLSHTILFSQIRQKDGQSGQELKLDEDALLMNENNDFNV